MRSSTRTLTRKPAPLPARKGTTATIQVQKNPSIIELIDRSKNYDYSNITKELQEAGATQKISDDDTKRYSSFDIYEMYFSGSSDYFRSPHFKDVREKEEEFLNVLIRNAKVVEGITSCPKCGYTKVSKITQRLRSADEPDVNNLKCMRCQKEWVESR